MPAPPDRPKLSPDQVAAIAAAAFESMHFSAELKYKPERPEYFAEDGIWHVYFYQLGRLVMIDGDMVVLVNDRSRKACVSQMMAPRVPCI